MPIVVTILVWFGPEARGYEATELEICAYSNRQWYAAVSGDIVVWGDYRNGNEDIYGYNLFTGTEVEICTDEASQSFPAVSGGIIVWEDERSGDKDIYGYDLSTHSRFSICTKPGEQEHPAISGDIVVWRDSRNGNWDIYGYDLSAKREFAICVNPNNQRSPAISGDIIVWTDARNGAADVYGYDLSTQSEFAICKEAGRQFLPAISGDIVVWEDYRNGNADIYGYDLSTKSEFPICTHGADQRGTAISGDIVVWHDGRNGDGACDIYARDLSTKSEFPICAGDWPQDWPVISDGVVVWRDYRNYNADIYGARISKGGNDYCHLAIEVEQDVPYSDSTVLATGTDMSLRAFSDTRDVWHWYKPKGDGQVTISLRGSAFDTTLTVLGGCGGIELAFNDDLWGAQSQVALDVVQGKTYLIRVAGFNGQTGDYRLLVTRATFAEPNEIDLNGECKVEMVDSTMFAFGSLDIYRGERDIARWLDDCWLHYSPGSIWMGLDRDNSRTSQGFTLWQEWLSVAEIAESIMPK